MKPRKGPLPMSLRLNLRGHPKGADDAVMTKTPPLLVNSIVCICEAQGALLEAHALNEEVMPEMPCCEFKEI